MSKRTNQRPERGSHGPERSKKASPRRGGRPPEDEPREGPGRRTGKGPGRPARASSTKGPGQKQEGRAGRPWREDGGEGARSARGTRAAQGDSSGSARPSRAGKPTPGRGPRRADAGEGGPRRPSRSPERAQRPYRDGDLQARRPFRKGDRSNRFGLPNPANEGLVRLNKYLAQAGVGSRREADLLITSGAVTVNGKVVTELGTKVKPEDRVHFGGQKLHMEQKRYVLLNKPKDTITTTDDPQERHTVMSLIAKACTERLYPVGRLDRNTTGVLLLTNDGDLAKKLTHPSHGAEKMYHATLDRALAVEELHKLVEGVELEDGPAKADEVSFVGASKREVGMSIHMGRNRIVRRMFQALGAEVVKLDRVMFAGLTKKELPRGHWRHLEEKEVTWLKQMKAAPKGGKEERGGRRTRLSQGSE